MKICVTIRAQIKANACFFQKQKEKVTYISTNSKKNYVPCQYISLCNESDFLTSQAASALLARGGQNLPSLQVFLFLVYDFMSLVDEERQQILESITIVNLLCCLKESSDSQLIAADAGLFHSSLLPLPLLHAGESRESTL